MFEAVLLAVVTALPSPNPPLPITLVSAPRAQLVLETASTPQERERGLMSRTSVLPGTGMLFVFDSDGPISFWMKDTLIPLDMVFVANDGTVRKVFSNVPVISPNTPDDEIPLESANARYVIELGAGEAVRDGIAPGVQLQFARTP